MKDIILSMLQTYLSINLVIVVVLLLTALWARETCPSGSEPSATALTTGQGLGDAAAARRSNLLPPRRDRRPFRHLQATLSLRYAARVEQAIRTIRIGPYAAARAKDQAAG
jgi:hypothetical protein